MRHATKSENGDELTPSETNSVQPAGALGVFLLALTATSNRMSPTAVPSGIGNENELLLVETMNGPNWPNFQCGGVIVVLAALTVRLHVVTAPTVAVGCSVYVYDTPATTFESLQVVLAPLMTGSATAVHTGVLDPIDGVRITE